MATRAPESDGRRKAAAVRRRKREAEIIAATRELFDQRGVREAQIEDIARAVGINRAIVYRHFSGRRSCSRSPSRATSASCATTAIRRASARDS